MRNFINCVLQTRMSPSSSDSLIPSRVRVRRQAGQGGNTVHAAPNVFSTFKKYCLVSHSTLQFLWSNSIFNKRKFSLTQTLTFIEAIPLQETVYSYSQQSRRFGTGTCITLHGHDDLNQAVTRSYWPQLYAVLGS